MAQDVDVRDRFPAAAIKVAASSRVATFPAWATTPVPSAEKDKAVDHVVCTTCEVPSV